MKPTRISSPIYAVADDACQHLYWGDVHGHTIFTDGVCSPEECYYFGRDEAFVDICERVHAPGSYYDRVPGETRNWPGRVRYGWKGESSRQWIVRLAWPISSGDSRLSALVVYR